MHNRLLQLDSLLRQSHGLWHESPFKVRRPAWCYAYPQLEDALLALSDAEVTSLERDQCALGEFIRPHIGLLHGLENLLRLESTHTVTTLQESRFGWEVPGRKLQQISAFAANIHPRATLLEWCGGKGHLGRIMAQRWQQAMATLEWDTALCDEGERLAQRCGVQQIFHRADALAQDSLRYTQGRHVLALHACGELHRQLIRNATSQQMQALDIAPCCYHLGSTEYYQPFSADLTLKLTRDDVRLAVTNSDTAASAQLRQRDQEMAWKLGFIAWREQLQGDDVYQNLRPIPKAWLKLEYRDFLQQLAEREGVQIDDGINADYWRQIGWQRQREVLRLNLLRMAFRRAIEMWLVLDMAVYLQQQGYTVTLREFCQQAITPRNIQLTAYKV